jgi:hypothetical protein
MNEIDRILVMFPLYTICKGILFFKLVCLSFLFLLAGRFHYFEQTQNREKNKQEMTLLCNMFKTCGMGEVAIKRKLKTLA